jgi:prevent-host-death family protein
MTKTLPISEAREHLRELVEQAGRTMDRVVITRNGKPEAVLMGYDEFESWAETLDIVSNPQEMEAIRAGEEALKAGDVVSFEEAFGEPLPSRDKAKRTARKYVTGLEVAVLPLLASEARPMVILDSLLMIQALKGTLKTVRRPQALTELSKRQTDVLRLLASGKTEQEIAQALHLSPKAVESYKDTIIRMLGLKLSEVRKDARAQRSPAHAARS